MILRLHQFDTTSLSLKYFKIKNGTFATMFAYQEESFKPSQGYCPVYFRTLKSCRMHCPYSFSFSRADIFFVTSLKHSDSIFDTIWYGHFWTHLYYSLQILSSFSTSSFQYRTTTFHLITNCKEIWLWIAILFWRFDRHPVSFWKKNLHYYDE